MALLFCGDNITKLFYCTVFGFAIRIPQKRGKSAFLSALIDNGQAIQ